VNKASIRSDFFKYSVYVTMPAETIFLSKKGFVGYLLIFSNFRVTHLTILKLQELRKS